MPDYKLMYFEARGQAEIARLLFAAGGVKYEDKRYNKDTWPAVKSDTPCGQLPVLVVDGQMFSQSIPIAVYLAEAFGLHGGSTMECFVVNEIIATASELKRKLSKPFFENDETKKAEIKKQLDEEEVPKYVKIFEKFLGRSDSGFFSKKLSVADIIVFDTLDKTVERKPEVLSGAPKLKANMDKVRSNPGVSNWLKNRPQTEH